MEGREKEHMMTLHQACAISPKRREYWGELANEHWRRGNQQVAIGLMEMALRLPALQTGQMQHAWYGDIPEKVLANWKECANRVHDP